MKMRLIFWAAIIIIWSCQAMGQWVSSFESYRGGVSSLGASGSTVFAGANGGEIFSSVDNGDTWTLVTSGEIKNPVTVIVANDSMIFAGTHGGGIFRHIINGDGWQRLAGGLSDSIINTILIESNGQIVAGTPHGVFISSNNGATWISHVSAFDGTSVLSLFQNGSGLFAGTSAGEIYFSSNSGVYWAERGTIGKHKITSLNTVGNRLFTSTADSGIFVSIDNGSKWTSADSGLFNLNIAGLTLNGTTIFAATSMGEGGAFSSADSGRTWSPVPGLHDSLFCAVLANGHNLYTASNSIDAGVLRSTDEGVTWSRVNLGGITNSHIVSFARVGSDIFAGTWGGGVLRSTDLGKTWVSVNSGLRNEYIECLAGNDSILLAGTYPYVWKSSDKGISWTVADSNQHGVCYHILFHDSSIYVAYGFNVQVSYDGGLTWHILTLPQDVSESANDVAVIDSSIFVGTATLGVIRSRDFGKSWVKCGSPINIVCMTVKDSILLIGTSNGVYVSSNYGDHWVSTGLSSGFIHALVAYGEYLFAGTDHGVYFSRDNGKTWTLKGQGLNQDVEAVLIIDSTAYAGTATNGVWVRPLSEMITGIQNKSQNNPLHFSLFENYPNPFNPSTIIGYRLPVRSYVTLNVYDILGREIETLVSGVKNAGSYSITFNASKLASGIYLYKLHAGNFVQVRKMILLK